MKILTTKEKRKIAQAKYYQTHREKIMINQRVYRKLNTFVLICMTIVEIFELKQKNKKKNGI